MDNAETMLLFESVLQIIENYCIRVIAMEIAMKCLNLKQNY